MVKVVSGTGYGYDMSLKYRSGNNLMRFSPRKTYRSHIVRGNVLEHSERLDLMVRFDLLDGRELYVPIYSETMYYLKTGETSYSVCEFCIADLNAHYDESKIYFYGTIKVFSEPKPYFSVFEIYDVNISFNKHLLSEFKRWDILFENEYYHENPFQNFKNQKNHLQNILFGLAVGDALGVPVEFESRQSLTNNPVTTMRDGGVHDVPAGTWSDDSAMTFCLVETINEGFDLQLLANKFIAWKNNNYWTPYGNVFDIGIATSQAINRLIAGELPENARATDEMSNGNGSLMRILPLVLHIKDKEIDERWQITKQVSSITHGHVRSVIACFYYLEFARLLINNTIKGAAFKTLIDKIPEYLGKRGTIYNKNNLTLAIQQVTGQKNYYLNKDEIFIAEIEQIEIDMFARLFDNDFANTHIDDIKSSGYVVHTLEASIWCLLNTNNYVDAVLKAVNLGEDSDTTAAVTGGLAGLLYGASTIPKKWIWILPKKKEINKLIFGDVNTYNSIEGKIAVCYKNSYHNDSDEFSEKFSQINYQTAAYMRLPDKNGLNLLSFEFKYPNYSNNTSISIDLDCDISFEANKKEFFNTIHAISVNEYHDCMINGTLQIFNLTTNVWDNFSFTSRFTYLGIQQIIQASTIYAEVFHVFEQ